MKKAKRSARNWFLFAFLSYILVSVVMGLGLALSPNAENPFLSFIFAFLAPFAIMKQVVLQPGNGKMWMGLGSAAFLFISCLWVLSRYFMDNPEDEKESARLKRLKELQPKRTPETKQEDSFSPRAK